MTNTVEELLQRRFRVAVVLGSGLSSVAGAMLGDNYIPYSFIDGFPTPTVAGHEGALYEGTVAGVPVLAFAGRAHLYEGHDAAAVTWGVRSAIEVGCEIVILTNVAGAISDALEVGAPCLISDHLNLTGTSPIPALARGDRSPFLDLVELYDRDLRMLAGLVQPGLPEGVYAGVTGPAYETPAEVRMLRTLGADLVGMSTVLEAIAARFLGARVLGISLVGNAAAGVSEQPLRHADIEAAGQAGAARIEALVRGVIERL